MLIQQQIEALANQLSATLKEGKPYTAYHEEINKLWERVKPHATEEFPKELISKKHPSETDEEFNYRKETYQAVTSSYWYRALNSINRIWQGFSVNWGEEDDYFNASYPLYNSLESYFKSIVTPEKINDPNTVLAVKPHELPIDEAGQLDDSEHIKPVAYLFNSDKIIDYVPSAYFIGLTDIKTEITEGNRKVNDGLVFEIYDDVNIWRLIQTGKKHEYKFISQLYYMHDLGYLPCWSLSGIPMHRQDRIIYKSYFSPAIPLLNTALLENSTLDGVIGKHGYPTRAYIEEDCDNPDCKGGFVYEKDNHTKCPTCMGTQKKRFSPFTDYVRRFDSRFDDPNIPFPGIEYISPPIEPMSFLDAKKDKDIIAAFQLINIDVSNIPNGQTATESKIDREELFSFLLLVSSELTQLFKNTVLGIGQMRYGSTYEMPTMIIPDEFTIRSSKDLTEEIKTAEDANLPDVIIDHLNKEYTKRRFSEDKKSQQYLDFRMQVDAFRNKKPDEISIAINSYGVPKWQGVLNANFDFYLSDFLREDSDFMEKEDSKQRIIDRAKQDTPSESVTTRLLNGNA